MLKFVKFDYVLPLRPSVRVSCLWEWRVKIGGFSGIKKKKKKKIC